MKLVMISAGFEHGGNIIHRHLDGHPKLCVYPFESQLGNKSFNDFLASVERVQYRYPEFPEGMTAFELYEEFIDEEMKTFLRKKNGSKFKNVNLDLNEKDRKQFFKNFLGVKGPFFRAKVIEAFFYSTFKSWRNYHTEINDSMTYVGYSPTIGIDADRLVKDFPEIKLLHIIRNPFSAYRDTKRRPFPQSINRYMITWNIYHSTVEMFQNLYPKNVKIFRYEDMLEDKELFMKDASKFMEIEYDESMLYPSWNGVEIKNDIAPWGTVLKTTKDYNIQLISELNEKELHHIVSATSALAKHFKYDEIDYLKKYYAK